MYLISAIFVFLFFVVVRFIIWKNKYYGIYPSYPGDVITGHAIKAAFLTGENTQNYLQSVFVICHRDLH